MSIKNKILVILGPTATGKTELALNLAKKINGELVSCDSRQVYVGLDIGSGKMPSLESNESKQSGQRRGSPEAIEESKVKKGKGFWEIEGIKVWMYDVVDPKEQYTIADYVQDAYKVIRYIRKRKKLPIVVGGTGLYLRVLIGGLSNLNIPTNQKLREKLKKLSLEELQKKLQEISSEKWNKMNYSDRQNPRRLIRAVELKMGKGDKSQKGDLVDQGLSKEFDILKIGLTATRDVLYQRSDQRVISRINHGMITEAKRLTKEGFSLKRMRQLGLEYGILADYISGEIRGIQGDQEIIRIKQNKQSLLACKLASKIHGFIRRQLTWFKKERDIYWFDITEKKFPKKLEKVVLKWYHHPDETEN